MKGNNNKNTTKITENNECKPNNELKTIIFLEMRDQLEDSTPLKRIGNPLDIGGVCLWLSSRAGDWITGTIITVDGKKKTTIKLFSCFFFYIFS